MEVAEKERTSYKDYVTPIPNPPAENYSYKRLAFAKRLPRDLWIVATDEPLANRIENVNYVHAGKAVCDLARSAAQEYPSLSTAKFRSMFRLIFEIVTWRRTHGYATVVVMEPPPLEYISAWERAFQPFGVHIAWLDMGNRAVPVKYTHPKIVLKRRPRSRDGDEWNTVASLEPGEHCRIRLLNPISYDYKTQTYKTSKEVFRYRDMTVQIEHAALRDRSFQVKVVDLEEGAGPTRKRGSDSKFIVIRRRTEEEHEERMRKIDKARIAASLKR